MAKQSKEARFKQYKQSRKECYINIIGAEKEKKSREFNSSPEGKLLSERKNLIYTLSVANKKHRKERVKNTEQFLISTLKFMRDEMESKFKGKKVTKKDLQEFAELYSAHIKVLKNYDKEMVFCPEPKSNQSLMQVFENFISTKIPILTEAFGIKTTIDTIGD